MHRTNIYLALVQQASPMLVHGNLLGTNAPKTLLEEAVF